MNLIHGLHFNNIRGDIFGGLTAAVVALPLALAFGVSSGAGPIAGLYGAIFVGLFAALFGGTPSQVSGPTGPMTVVMAGIFTHYVALDPVQGPALAFTVVMMGGAFQILFGVLKIGRYINYMPQPVISGFMSGIGVIIILLQLGVLLGGDSSSGPLSALQSLPDAMRNVVWEAVLIGIITIAIVYLTPAFISRVVPPPLLALFFGTLLVAFVFNAHGLTILGEMPTGLPSFQIPTIPMDLLPGMVNSAVILALLGTIDSLLTSLVADNITRSHHNSNRELIGQGIGNTISGLFGGLPGAGATMRTMVNVRAGGQTPISGALHALVLLSILLGLGSVASYIPHVVLAGILIKVGTDIIDWGYLKRSLRSSRSGVVIMYAVLGLTVFVDLLTAVGVGVVMASLLFLKRQSDIQLASIRVIRGAEDDDSLSSEENDILVSAGGKVLLFYLAGPISFGAAKDMIKLLAREDDFNVLVLDVSDVPSLDYSASCAIKDMLIDSLARNKKVVVASGDGVVLDTLWREDSLSMISDTNIHASRISALRCGADIASS